MAFVVPTKRGRFEVRESHSTPEGPRSRTLVSFRELDDDAVDRALARATKPFDPAKLRRAALRVGAPVAPTAVDRAASEAVRLLAKGNRPDPVLRRLLLDALQNENRRDGPEDPNALVSANARAASEWIGVDAGERGRVLGDLLGLADALPIRRRPPQIGFPHLRST